MPQLYEQSRFRRQHLPSEKHVFQTIQPNAIRAVVRGQHGIFPATDVRHDFDSDAILRSRYIMAQLMGPRHGVIVLRHVPPKNRHCLSVRPDDHCPRRAVDEHGLFGGDSVEHTRKLSHCRNTEFPGQ